MASPEHLFHRPHVVFAPDDKTGGDASGQIGNENFQHLELDQQASQAVGLVVQSLARGRKRIDLPSEEIAAEYSRSVPVRELAQQHRVSTTTIYRRLHEVGLPKREPKINADVIENVDVDERQFCWWRDLSLNAQNLYKLLVSEAGDRDSLPRIATQLNFDLEAALDELRAFGFLDESDPITGRSPICWLKGIIE